VSRAVLSISIKGHEGGQVGTDSRISGLCGGARFWGLRVRGFSGASGVCSTVAVDEVQCRLAESSRSHSSGV
jgi:hypothetical protein